jgi:hypothetical protein
MAARRIHIRRYADVTMGSMINGAKTKIQKLALRRGISFSRGQSQFNEAIRNNSPSIYLVDPELIASTVLETLTTNPKFISAINTEAGLIQAEDSEFNEAYKNISLPTNLNSDLAANIRTALYNNFSKTTTAALTNITERIYNDMLVDMEKAERSGRSYISFQTAAAKAGAELRRELNSVKIAILEDADKIISNIQNRIPFVTYSFTAGVRRINEVIQKTVDTSISKYFNTTENFSVGNLVHAGHVGVYSDEGLVGINMPAATIAGLVSGKFHEIEQAIGNLDIHIEQGLKMNTNYTAKAGMFLDLQFNFAVSMTAGLNSATLSPLEIAAIRSVVENISNEGLEQALREQISSESVQRLETAIGASPSMEEFIFQAIVDSISGKQVKALKHTVAATTSRDISRNLQTNSKKTKPVTKAKAPNKKKPNRLKRTSSREVSLTSLQNLINLSLAQRIKENMGDGSRRDILNLRTGRFAESVKVERMSVSREGMITAFYTYMKNPYQTFEPGFRQGSPQTRNPKLLISKSIREIAAQQVANRMRAVSI